MGSPPYTIRNGIYTMAPPVPGTESIYADLLRRPRYDPDAIYKSALDQGQGAYSWGKAALRFAQGALSTAQAGAGAIAGAFTGGWGPDSPYSRALMENAQALGIKPSEIGLIDSLRIAPGAGQVTAEKLAPGTPPTPQGRIAKRVGGLAGDIALDPINWFTGGLVAGRRAAGLASRAIAAGRPARAASLAGKSVAHTLGSAPAAAAYGPEVVQGVISGTQAAADALGRGDYAGATEAGVEAALMAGLGGLLAHGTVRDIQALRAGRKGRPGATRGGEEPGALPLPPGEGAPRQLPPGGRRAIEDDIFDAEIIREIPPEPQLPAATQRALPGAQEGAGLPSAERPRLPAGPRLPRVPTAQERTAAQVQARLDELRARIDNPRTQPARRRKLRVERVELLKQKNLPEPEPTPAQAAAGNYLKGHEQWEGYGVSIETARGGVRRGVDEDGYHWQVKDFPADYGAFRRTVGEDGEGVDVFMGKDLGSDKVWVLEQVEPFSQKFDEHKAFIGFKNPVQVQDVWERAFESDHAARLRQGELREMTVPEFKAWLAQRSTDRVPRLKREMGPMPLSRSRARAVARAQRAKALREERAARAAARQKPIVAADTGQARPKPEAQPAGEPQRYRTLNPDGSEAGWVVAVDGVVTEASPGMATSQWGNVIGKPLDKVLLYKRWEPVSRGTPQAPPPKPRGPAPLQEASVPPPATTAAVVEAAARPTIPADRVQAVDKAYPAPKLEPEVGGAVAGDEGQGGALLKSQREIESKTIARVEREGIDSYVEKYRERWGEVWDADNVRELFPEYQKDRGSNAMAVQAVATGITNTGFRQRLLTPVEPGRDPVAVFMAGGPGAGKSSINRNAKVKAIKDRAHVVLDSNLAGAGALKKMKAAAAAGLDVVELHVHTEPMTALRQALARSTKQEKQHGSGRTLPIDVFTRNHMVLPKMAVDRVDEIGHTLVVYDPATGKTFEGAAAVERLRQAPYYEGGAEREAYAKSLREEVDRQWREGTISASIYRGFIGHDPPAPVRGAAPGGAGEPHPGRPEVDVGQLLPGSLALGERTAAYDPSVKRPKELAGAPASIRTAEDAAALEKHLVSMAKEGEVGRHWYETSSDRILELTQGNAADGRMLVKFLAIYSARQSVKPNWNTALKAFAQWKAGKKISVPGLPEKNAKANLVVKGETFAGLKSNNFYVNLMRRVDPEGEGRPDSQGATVDVHMMRALGYPRDAPGAAQYRWASAMIHRVAKQLGWEPQQAQAAIWTSQKWRVARDKALAKGEEPPEIDTFDFAAASDLARAQVSWEATPARDSGILPGIHDAPYELRQAYTDEIADALLDENGVDEIASALGLLRGDAYRAAGSWEGEFNPSIQVEVQGAPKGDQRVAALDETAQDLIERYAAAIGLVTNQWAVGYHRPFPAAKVADSNGVEFRVGEMATKDRISAVYDEVVKKLGAEKAQGIVLIPTPEGLRVLNDVKGLDNKEFHKLLRSAFSSAYDDVQSARMVRFGSAGRLIERGGLDGGDYRRRLGAPGGPDISGAVERVSRRTAAVNERWAREHGWGEPGKRVEGGAAPARAEGGGERVAAEPRGPPALAESTRGFYDEPQTRAEADRRGAEAVRALGRKRAPVSTVSGVLGPAGSGVRTLATKLRRVFARKGRVDLRGVPLRNAEDLATIAQTFRDPRFETFRQFYVVNGRIVAHEGFSSRQPNFVVPYDSGEVAKQVNQLRRRIERIARREGVSPDDVEVWMTHNHPSANPTASIPDVNLTGVVKEKIPQVKGHVVTDHGEYSFIDPDAALKLSRLTQQVAFDTDEAQALFQAAFGRQGNVPLPPKVAERVLKLQREAAGLVFNFNRGEAGLRRIRELDRELSRLISGADALRYKRPPAATQAAADALDQRIDGMEDLGRIASSLHRDPSWVPIIVTDTQGRVVSILEMPQKLFVGKGAGEWLRHAARTYGGTRIFAALPESPGQAEFARLTNEAHALGQGVKLQGPGGARQRELLDEAYEALKGDFEANRERIAASRTLVEEGYLTDVVLPPGHTEEGKPSVAGAYGGAREGMVQGKDFSSMRRHRVEEPGAEWDPAQMRDTARKEGFALFEPTRFNLDQAAADAMERLRQRGQAAAFELGGAAGQGAGALRDVSIVGAKLIRDGLTKFKDWAVEMTKQLGGIVSDLGRFLRSIWARSKKESTASAPAPEAAGSAPPAAEGVGAGATTRQDFAEAARRRGRRPPLTPEQEEAARAAGRTGEPPYVPPQRTPAGEAHTGVGPVEDVPLGEPKAEGEPPRVDTRVEGLRGAEEAVGKPPSHLDRETRRRWKDLDPQVRKLLREWSDEDFYRVMGRRTLDDVETQAWDAVVRGKEQALEDAQARLTAAEAGGGDASAERRVWLDSNFDYIRAQRAAVQDGTAAARALAARRRVMRGARPDDDFIRKVFREIPGVTDEQAAELLRAFKTDRTALYRLLTTAVARKDLIDKALEAWKAGLLSGFSTDLANITGNSVEAGVRIVESATAPVIDRLLDALPRSMRGKGGRSRFLEEAGAEATGIADHFLPALQKAARTMGEVLRLKDPEVDVRRALEILPGAIEGKKGAFVRIPFRMLETEDQFFKAIIAGGEMRRQAWRKARRALGSTAERSAVAERAAQIERESWADWGIAEGGRETSGRHDDILSAVREAQISGTFQEDRMRAMMRLVRTNRGLQVIFPFVRTPGNIALRTLQRSPYGFFGRAGREYSAVEALKLWREGKIDRGSAVDAITRPVVGTAILAGFTALAQSGVMTGSGPTDPRQRSALREAGWQPYSFVFSTEDGRDYYLPFNRFEPVSSSLGFAADLAEIRDQEQAGDVFQKGLGSIMENLTNKSYLRGMIDVSEALSDPNRYADRYITDLAGSVVPNIVGRAAWAVDPVTRETRGEDRSIAGLPGRIGRKLQSRIPFASRSLPAVPTSTGSDRELATALPEPAAGVSRFLSPVQPTRLREGSELEQAFAEIGYTPPTPSREMTYHGRQVRLTDREFEIMRRAAESAAQKLRPIVASPRFGRLDQEGKRRIIEDAFRDVRSAARRLIQSTPSFRRRALATAG